MHTQTGIYKAEGKKNTSKIFHLNFSLLNRARYELGKNSRLLNVNLSFPFFKLFCFAKIVYLYSKFSSYLNTVKYSLYVMYLYMQ